MDLFAPLLAALRETYETATLVLLGGGIIGLMFGVVAERSGFCLRSAVIEAMQPSGTSGKSRPPRQATQFASAMLVAVVLTQALSGAGIIDMTGSIYHSAPFNILAIAIGGFVFGVGMILAGGCVSRLLVLAATGNLRSWVTLIVMAVAAYATLRGILSYLRTALETAVPSNSQASTLAGLTGLSDGVIAAMLAVVLGVLVVCLAARAGWRHMVPGAAVGALVAIAWLTTGVIGFDEFEPTPLQALSFTAPVAESLQYLMIATGDTLRFGIAVVAGLLVGAFASAALGGRLIYRGFQSEAAPLRYVAGGLLMGFGGVTALGCSMGQGLSGISTLATGSVVALAAILAGAALTQVVVTERWPQAYLRRRVSTRATM